MAISLIYELTTPEATGDAEMTQRTTTIRLGHAIVLLPFAINHPLRVAERIAVLDILSNGRAEFGGGRAISESELSAFGVDPEDTKAQWEESLRMLPEMWTQEGFSWESPLISVPPRTVTPKPLQKPHPPLWVSATQPATIEFAGKNGLGVLGFGIGQGDSDNFVRPYREEIKTCTPIGEFVNDRFAFRVHSLCLPTDNEAQAIQGPNFAKHREQVRALFAPWTPEGKAPRSYGRFMKFCQEQQEKLAPVTMEDIISSGGAAIGSPETCLRTIRVWPTPAGTKSSSSCRAPIRRTTRSCSRSSCSRLRSSRGSSPSRRVPRRLRRS
ncbi:MAG: LLM class flavin-dependent oxidoreductase [Dehalococcoidia bacterium]